MEIFKKTNGKYMIEKQDETDLSPIMKWIYSEHGKSYCVKPSDVRKEVTFLDNLVVKEVVPGIMSNIVSYLRYMKDVFGQRQILDRPINVSNAGSRLLPSVMSRI